MNYEMFFAYSMDIFAIAALDGFLKRANPALCDLVGRTEAQLLSRPLTEWMHPEDVPSFEGALRNLKLGHPAFLVEMRLLGSDGTYHSLLWSAYADPASDLVYAMARSPSSSGMESQRVRLLMDSSPTAVFLVEETGTISYSNHLAEAIFGYEESELIGKPIEMLVPQAARARHERQRDAYTRKPVLRPIGTVHNLVGLRRNGEEFPVDVGLNPVWLGRGTTIICSVIDASAKTTYLRGLMEERRRLSEENSRLGRLADRDDLTGLYNRRAFQRILLADLSEARQNAGAVSILFADIDHFKDFNDEFGHLTGDVVLKRAAETLARNVRKEDTVARIGGEEFVVILPGIGREQSMAFGERLRTVIEQMDWAAKPVTISLGATTRQFTSGRTALRPMMKQMIWEADQAMYFSKKMGRNRFIHFLDIPEEGAGIRPGG